MSDDRREHIVVIGGVEHTMLLDADDADRLRATLVAKAATAQNKARTTAPNK